MRLKRCAHKGTRPEDRRAVAAGGYLRVHWAGEGDLAVAVLVAAVADLGEEALAEADLAGAEEEAISEDSIRDSRMEPSSGWEVTPH